MTKNYKYINILCRSKLFGTINFDFTLTENKKGGSKSTSEWKNR